MTEVADTPDSAVSVDRVLLERLRAGEDAAYGELFSRYSGVVLRLALNLVRDRAEAEDLTAETFFRVLQAIRRGSGPQDNVRGYLLIVVRRVAWEWQLRRRDVPVSDEELTHRAGWHSDGVGLATERSLITRAFHSLPERWRSVLWKVEVEGERPAVVATNFGLSPNATAALARRARQGLRAAYLQAHLSTDRSVTNGCRSMVEKLGAYTAGTVTGAERRRIQAHLSTCPSCAARHGELREVCSRLRVHAAYLAVPATLAGAWQLAAPGAPAATVSGGFGAAVKGALVSAKSQVVLAATTAAGVLGLVLGPWQPVDDQAAYPIDLDGDRQVRLEATDPGQGTTPPQAFTTRQLSTVLEPGLTASSVQTESTSDGAVRTTGDSEPESTGSDSETVTTIDSTEWTTSEEQGEWNEAAPVVYRETSTEWRTEEYRTYTVVFETVSITEVNADEQTRTATETEKYTQPAEPSPPSSSSRPPPGSSSAPGSSSNPSSHASSNSSSNPPAPTSTPAG